ncbi:MAG: hypothetical protein KatS3mg052_0588 [Candidatus Roseilinea sp.]|nr:MAG: hypothetical protein KatS3mg052_0588 [Candidatus Roseilinea sp.]
MSNVKVLVTLQDDAGNALQSAVASIPLSAVPANQTSPFRVLFTNPPPGFTKFVVVPLRAEAVDPRAFIIPLAVRNVIGRPDGPQFRVTGEIANITADTANQVRLMVTIYDAERRVGGLPLLRPERGTTGAKRRLALRRAADHGDAQRCQLRRVRRGRAVMSRRGLGLSRPTAVAGQIACG